MRKMDAAAMSEWVFESLLPGAEGQPGKFKECGCSIVVAGRNFGCGSKSVEHPMAALLGAGVKLVIAESFSRYSYRNAINLGLPAIVCPGITQAVSSGDMLEVDALGGTVKNLTSGQTLRGYGLGEFAMGIIANGGLLNTVMKR